MAETEKMTQVEEKNFEIEIIIPDIGARVNYCDNLPESLDSFKKSSPSLKADGCTQVFSEKDPFA